MKRRLVAPGAGLLLLLSAMPGSTLAGVGTLDQSNTVNTECYQSAGLYGQTFTVGMAGQLVAVDLLLREIPPGTVTTVTVKIENLDRSSMVPSGHVLASANVLVGAQAWYTASLSAPPSFLVGARLAIVVNLDDGGCIFGSDESYAGGVAYRKPGLLWVAAGGDYDFKTYMVAPAPTPTPTPKPIVISTPTPTPAASSSPTEPPASETPSASPSASPEPSPTEPAVSDTPSATAMPSPGSASGSGGSTDPTVPVVVAGILVLGLGLGVLGFMLGRKQQTKG